MDLRTHPESYVTASQLARYWSVSRRQVYKQIETGALKALRLGPRILRISTADAIAFERSAHMAVLEDVHAHSDESDPEGPAAARDRRRD